MRSLKRWLRRQLLDGVRADIEALRSELADLRTQNKDLAKRCRELEKNLGNVRTVAHEGRRLGQGSVRSLETLMQRELLLRRDVNALVEQTELDDDVRQAG